jgi:mannan endo-1,4-beta-mannosidase
MFVAATGTRFTLAGRPFRATGANCYYLPYSSPASIDRLFDTARDLGLNVIRTWAFLDEEKNGVRFHSFDQAAQCCVVHPGSNGLERLDYVLQSAAQRGLRLILPLVNNWQEFGGIPQYARWFGLAGHADFYTHPRACAAYENWMRTLVTRVNRLTNVAYRDDPTIFAWELTNEAQCPGAAHVLVRWVHRMAHALKQLDPHHLVAVGDEGFFNRWWPVSWPYTGVKGVDFEEFLRVDAIDFGTYHLYPESWSQPRHFGIPFIEAHARAAARAHKPVVMEEYGWKDPAERDEVYADWLAAARGTGHAGDLFWMLAAEIDGGARYPDYDGFTLYADTVPSSVREHHRLTQLV